MMRLCFHSQNNSNAIEVRELRSILSKITSADAIVDVVMARYDNNVDGRIDRSEFARLATEHPEIVTGALRSLWSRFDISTPRGEVSAVAQLAAFAASPAPPAAQAAQTAQTAPTALQGAESSAVQQLSAGQGDRVELLSASPDHRAANASPSMARSPLSTPPLVGSIVYRK